MNGNILLKIIGKNGKVVLQHFIIFAFVCDSDFSIEAWRNGAIFTERYRETRWLWLFNSDLLFVRTDVSDHHGDFINFIEFCINEVYLLLGELESRSAFGIDERFVEVRLGDRSVNGWIKFGSIGFEWLFFKDERHYVFFLNFIEIDRN